MSYRAQDWAIMQQAGDPTAKAVLIALAWSLNTKDGLCCPSLATLAKLSDVKQRHTVLDAVVRLEKAGLIRRTMAKAKNGSGKKTYYTFPGLATWDGVTSEVTPVTSEVTTPVTPQVTPPVTSKVTPVTSEVMGCYLKGNGVLPQRELNREDNKEENRGEVHATQIFSAEKIARPEPDLAEEINSQLRDAVDRDPDDFDPVDATPEALDIFDTEPLSVGGTKAAPCPVTEIVALYNKKLGPYLRTVRKMTPARAQAVRARWRDVAEIVESQDRATVMEGMSDYFDKIARSNFLMGRVPGKAWRADFDFIFSQRGFTRIFEDKYANG